MPYHKYEFWASLLTNMKTITTLLVAICAFVGAAAPFVKGERQFKISLYIFEVLSSMSAGTIVYLLLKVTSTPEEWIAAVSGLSAYFGTKLLTTLYAIFIKRLQKALRAEDDEEKKS